MTQTEHAPVAPQGEAEASVTLSPGVQQQLSTNPETFNTNEVNTTPETQAEMAAESWMYADGIPGEGEAPEWFNKKSYKSVADQAKAHTELRKLLGGFTGAPDSYALELDGDYKDFKVDGEDPAIKKFSELAKTSNMSQDLFSNTLKLYADLQNQETQSLKEFQEQEMAKIGPNPQENLNELATWFKQNYPEISDDSFKSLITSYDAYKLFSTIREKKGQVLPSSTEAVASQKNRDDFAKMMSDKRYGKDMIYTQRVDNEFVKYADHIEL